MNPPIFVSVSTEPGIPSAERKSVRYDEFVKGLLKPLPEQLNALHIAVGLAGELGELHEAICDEVEELGDYEFYFQAALLHYGLTHLETTFTYYTGTVDADGFVYWTGHLIDCIKREYIYNKPRELDCIIECMGFINLYLTDTYTDMDVTRQDILQENAIKLEKRYAKLYYSDEAAIARADKDQGSSQN